MQTFFISPFSFIARALPPSLLLSAPLLSFLFSFLSHRFLFLFFFSLLLSFSLPLFFSILYSLSFFLGRLEALAHDKTPNVRMVVVCVLPPLMLLFLSVSFRSGLASLANDHFLLNVIF